MKIDNFFVFFSCGDMHSSNDGVILTYVDVFLDILKKFETIFSEDGFGLFHIISLHNFFVSLEVDIFKAEKIFRSDFFTALNIYEACLPHPDFPFVLLQVHIRNKIRKS